MWRWRWSMLTVLMVGSAMAAEGGIGEPLTAVAGNAARGRAIVVNRQVGLCLLCHQGPFPEERFQGNLATDLAGAGSRWSAAQLRARIVDARRLQPGSLMPPYFKTSNQPLYILSFTSRQ